jgi:hypothetical protein
MLVGTENGNNADVFCFTLQPSVVMNNYIYKVIHLEEAMN